MLLLSLLILPPIVYSYGETLLVFCDPMDCSLQGSSVHGISQARILEWVAISCSKGSVLPTQGSNPCLLHCRRIYHWATRETHSILFALLNMLEVIASRQLITECEIQGSRRWKYIWEISIYSRENYIIEIILLLKYV